MRKMVIAVTMLALVLVPTMVFAANYENAEVTVNVSVAEWAATVADTDEVNLVLKDANGWHLAGFGVTLNSNCAVNVVVEGTATNANWDNMDAVANLQVLANVPETSATATFVPWPTSGKWYDGLIGNGARGRLAPAGTEGYKLVESNMKIFTSSTGRKTFHNLVATSVKDTEADMPASDIEGELTLTFTISPQQ